VKQIQLGSERGGERDAVLRKNNFFFERKSHMKERKERKASKQISPHVSSFQKNPQKFQVASKNTMYLTLPLSQVKDNCTQK